jgi:hypothetical protein
MENEKEENSWPVSGIWSRKFYIPKILGKQKQNDYCIYTEQIKKAIGNPEQSNISEALLKWF